MTSTNPALVTQRAAQRLPRIALLLFCAAYVLPGVFGRDPWKNADLIAFGYMHSIANGQSGWLTPAVGGLAADAALLPYWLGASFIALLSPWIDASVAARIPFALLLVVTLALTWYASFHLARTEAAQPLPFAFGGEADPTDYARAIADGALLALIATLGLLQLGHETTPELGQLAAVALFLYGLAASPYRGWRPIAAVVVALPALAASGAPSIAAALGATGMLICARSGYGEVRRFTWTVGLATLLAVIVASTLGAWAWRATGVEWRPAALWLLVRQIGWFTWPAWPLALWTLWRWRGHLQSRHISIPLVGVLVSTTAWIAMGGFDRALMLSLPALAVLSAFALPTLHRSTAAAIDWFSVFFFTSSAVVIWVVYASMQTGVPAKPAANIERLSPGYAHSFSVAALLLAAAGTLAWLWLVKWRTGRNRHPLWKSMVLPASGVALCWLLAMTLLLPPLDHARSYRALVARIAEQSPRGACISAVGLPRALIVALEFLGQFHVDAVTPVARTGCTLLLRPTDRRHAPQAIEGWALVAREQRSPNEDDAIAIYRRTTDRSAP